MNKKEMFFLAILIATNILIAFWLYPSFFSIGTDGVIYALVGENIAEGNGISLYGQPHTVFPPLLPYTIALFYSIIGNLELAAHMATLFWWLASIPLFYLLSKELFSRRTALVSVILFAFSGQLILQFTTVPTPQSAAGFFAILIFFALYKVSQPKLLSRNKNMIWLFLLGLFMGLAYLARSEYFLLILPALIFIFFVYKKDFSLRTALKAVAVTLLMFIIIVSPYLFFLKNSMGYWTISGKFGGVALGLIQGDHDLEAETGDSFITAVNIHSEVKTGILEESLQSASDLSKRFFKHLRDAERGLVRTFGFIGVIFLAFGLRELIKNKEWKILWIMLISLLLLPLVVFVVTNIANYLTPYYFVFILLIGLGVTSFADELKNWFAIKTRNPKILLIILTGATLFYFFFPVIQSYLFWPEDIQPREHKELGLWMKENIPGIEREVVLARKPGVSFYSGSEFELIPNLADIGSLVDYMKEKEIKYLVIDNRYMPEDREHLLDISKLSGFKLIYRAEFYSKEAMLFRLK